MPLYIRDDEVDALASELQSLTRAPSKTAAVKSALKNEVERRRKQVPLADAIRRIQEDVRRLGPPDPNFDFKKFREELWGDED